MSPLNLLRLFGIASGVLLLLIESGEVFYILKLERTVGVVDLHEGLKAGQPVMLPSVTYTRKDGRRWSHTPSREEAIKHFQAGDEITIMYDPSGKTSLIGRPRIWISPILTGCVGIMITIFACVAFRTREQAKPKAAFIQ